ncbi:MAG TPA: hypothetical protein VGK17_21395 [Propionicimonas sp.]|jgi:hypothetical protein
MILDGPSRIFSKARDETSESQARSDSSAERRAQHRLPVTEDQAATENTRSRTAPEPVSRLNPVVAATEFAVPFVVESLTLGFCLVA